MEEVRARHARAAEELLKHQGSPADVLNTALKRPNVDEDDPAAAQHEPKRPRYEVSRSHKKALAPEWAKKKQVERLIEVGGNGKEHILRGEIIDLDWEHIDGAGTCEKCYTKKNTILAGMWKCPDGGLLVCRPFLNRLSTYTG
jgi:hypothetical protein